MITKDKTEEYSKTMDVREENIRADYISEENNREVNNKEVNNKESNNKKSKNKKTNDKESNDKESNDKESNNKELNNKESNSKELNNREASVRQKIIQDDSKKENIVEEESMKEERIKENNPLEEEIYYEIGRAFASGDMNAIKQASARLNQYRNRLIRSMQPKAEYYDKVLNRKELIPIGVIAKDLGVSSACRMNTILNINGIIYNTGKGWVPFAEYEWLITEGYADYRSNIAGQPLTLYWTEKGREWIVFHFPGWIKITNEEHLPALKKEKIRDENPNLSEKTKKVLLYIQAFILAHGYSPSIREICMGVGVRSTSTVQNHINRLESKGYIIKKDLSPRNMRINEEMFDKI